MAVLENKETGEVNPTRLRLASNTGPPNWRIEKRYIQLLDEMGATDRAIAELQRLFEDAMVSRGELAFAGAAAAEDGTRGRSGSRRSRRARRYDVHLRELSGAIESAAFSLDRVKSGAGEVD